MKNFLKKLHIGSNQSEDSECSASSSKGNRLSDGSPKERLSHKSDHKPFSNISGWLNSVTHRHSPSPPSSSNVTRGDKVENSDSLGSSSFDSALEAMRRDSGVSNPRDHDIEEEYQIQMALELSAKEDPEAVQIEAVKQISLGSCPPENTPAEVVAYRYWNYNALSYDDKILDGFYDLYGILTESTSSRMPSLVDLQGTPPSDDITWEAILINKSADTKLLNLERRALEMVSILRSHTANFVTHNMVQKLAILVSDHMGGPVTDPDRMFIAWRNLSHTLKATNGSMVLPLGSLTIGLARHRALLFKVLADSLSIPCRLVKGQQFTGSDDVAINFVKIDGMEHIVDLMADPGTLIPSDIADAHMDYENVVPPEVTSFSGDQISSFEDTSEVGAEGKRSKFSESIGYGKEPLDIGESLSSVSAVQKPLISHRGTNDLDKLWPVKGESALGFSSGPSHPYMHARSPSWTEGVSSPAVRRMKVKDVSQYMIDAAKENPQLAQKLHDVLRESGVVAPPDLFTETYQQPLDTTLAGINPPVQEKEMKWRDDKHRPKGYSDPGRSFLPPLPHHGGHSKGHSDKHAQQQLHPQEVTEIDVSSDFEVGPAKYAKNVPVAAAAAAAAAVVASSMVVAAAKANRDPKLQLPVAAAATATAAAVVATTAAVTNRYEALESSVHISDYPGAVLSPAICGKSDGDSDSTAFEQASGDRENEWPGANLEGERISDRSTGNESSKSDVTLDDVADCEIPWEDITLGSYGEVYRGEWHGTEVAVKKFLDQDITGESLEEFKSEVRIMKRVRHPNVVLFMGAVTRPPNLSIVTEFLPRGSLYRLIHRPNNQLDERRRMKMAIDAARGMNYLHNCTPVIVHRDLKSPNLLVDKNWVVKVCDFGLSRMKHSTFLSSRSTAGTAEWMAPEVLRNEPSNEKSDVYSFGVILWELCTLQQPWGGMNPMQVVGAVGFQHRRLDIPEDMDPVIADVIRKCWQTDPNLRPSFGEIMAILKPLQKQLTTSQLSRPNKRPDRGHSSVNLENSGDRKS
ncbi:probable serine/threonine-protein kinase SIS8 isoform X2 [Andrographis paniculata]|uniref:probable serine/threonine-protein kinase SIS8 isoform X2 n=1 Tax=Andrographis paniculata TaxID=175694 RepID=UPI0021E8B5E4|nr:probable serine/threonine-protein kinase SIS8 isoform X2 [Andrographis paniculata]